MYARSETVEDKLRRRGAVPILIGAIVIIAIAVVVVAVIGLHNLSSSPTSHTPTTSPHTPTTPPPDPVATAQSIGLQAGDLNGYAFTQSEAGHAMTLPDAATACAPSSGQPPSAVVASGLYANNSNSALSVVELLPSAADATAGLSAVTAAPGGACVKAQGDAFVNAVLARVNQGAGCPLTLSSSGVTPLTASAGWAGATGFRYVASLTCQGQHAGVTADFADESIGNVFIEGRFLLFGGPQPGLEQGVMGAMAARAQAYEASHQ
jgi:hypothetical protein